jgi:hypothetical protein
VKLVALARRVKVIGVELLGRVVREEHVVAGRDGRKRATAFQDAYGK